MGDSISNERAILVGLIYGEQTEEKLNEYLEELAFLSETAGATVQKIYKQKLSHPDNRTFVGKGKIEEMALYIEENDIDLVIFDDDLSPSQQFNIEKELKRKIVDRSYLILDIFAKRARTAQARAQVELAQMQYLLPRLRGMWTHLERQKGGIGMRGPGEKEIETDRRIVNDKISKLKKRLIQIDKQNETRRKARQQLIRVALVGYTNVGKSTIMNLLSKSDVFAENKLFATLDTTIRKVVFEMTPFLLSDTVGFIRKLPHSLIESFKSTLDELRESDLLLHVIDLSHPYYEDQIEVVNKTIIEIGAQDIPVIFVFNKLDQFRDHYFDEFLKEEDKKEILEKIQSTWLEKTEHKALFISALKKENIAHLRQFVLHEIKRLYKERYPYLSEFY
ncbi:UNVERIFIED_CONTAM: hypothetical protein GTU68_062314 [Idotea baltica]|nr:hypothetical protein [Idotea baltica]